MTVDASGNIVAAGQSSTTSLTPEGLVVRLTPNGTLDTTFGGTGYLETSAVRWGAAAFTSVAVVPQVPAGYAPPTGVAPPTDVGDIVAGGYSTTATNGQALTVAAFSGINGAPDTQFAGGATQFLPATTATGLTVISGTTLSTPQPHLGDIVAVGPTSTGVDLVQFQANGALDPTFGSGGQVAVQSSAPFLQTAIAYQPFGGFLTVAGMTTPTNPQPPPPQFQSALVAQYNAINGTANTAFGTNGQVTEAGANNQPAVRRRGRRAARRQDGGRRRDPDGQRRREHRPDALHGSHGVGGQRANPERHRTGLGRHPEFPG